MGANHEPPGVVVLFNTGVGLVKGEPRDALAEEGVTQCARAVSGALRGLGFRVQEVPVDRDVELALSPYPPTEWMVFNLGEGLEGRLFEEPRIVWALEAMGYWYTGSDGHAVANSVDKARAKALLVRNGVSTPPWMLVRHPDELRSGCSDVAFPLIVKPVAEDASIGVGPEAVVWNLSALRERVGYVVERYRQAALCEAFVVGREFNVSVWCDPPDVLPLAEIDFGAFANPYERIVSFAAKWEESSFEYQNTPVICPAPVDADLADAIVETALRSWAAIGSRGYARVDMRLGERERLQVVEVNCNPDLSPEAGFHRAARAAGYRYGDMVARIVDIARRHYRVCDRFGPESGRAGHSGHHRWGGHLHVRGTRVCQEHLACVPE